MSAFRYAVWSAVSSDEQVQDHDSLTNQIRDCRAYAERLGGIETHAPFIADGYSRSFYEGLSEAMQEIPPLAEAVRAAETNQFDVLMVRYFERLGVVAYPTFLRLGKLRKQLRSVQEPTPILPPELYEPTKDEATSTMIHLAGLKQDYRINRIINNLRENMPKRIREGLTPSRIPYGYTYVNRKTPPTLDPEKAAKLIQARDMLMAGESLNQIGAFLGVHRSRVPLVLGNPYYAGQVSYGKTYVQRLGVKSSQIKQPKSKWLTGSGKHQPVFTPSEHEEITLELDRREGVKRRNKVSFVFANLLRCAVCGDRVRRHRFGSKDKYRNVITCRTGYSSHVLWDYDQFFMRIGEQIGKALQTERSEAPGEREDKSELIRASLEAGKKRRGKIQEGFEAGLYDAREASAKLRELEKETERLQSDLEQTAYESASRLEASTRMQELDLSDMPRYLMTGDPIKINRILTAWLKEIRVGKKLELIRR